VLYSSLDLEILSRSRSTNENVTSPNNSRRVGLARALSKLGFCSRSAAFDLIRAGKVRLNGNVQLDPEFPVHMEKDRLEADGRAVVASSRVYLMLNKPRGVVTTASDEKCRKTVYDFLRADLPWVAPVGRLDKASEGLLLLTNDSEWSARVLAPESQWKKPIMYKSRQFQRLRCLNPCAKASRPGTVGLQLAHSRWEISPKEAAGHLLATRNRHLHGSSTEATAFPKTRLIYNLLAFAATAGGSSRRAASP
jgi:hypothetical protein